MIENEIKKGTITVEEMVECFETGLRFTLDKIVPHIQL